MGLSSKIPIFGFSSPFLNIFFMTQSNPSVNEEMNENVKNYLWRLLGPKKVQKKLGTQSDVFLGHPVFTSFHLVCAVFVACRF